MTKPIISVVIGSYNRLPYLKQTIKTVRDELTDIPHEIFVVDGGSKDRTMSWLPKQKDIITIIQHNRGEWLGKKIPRRSWGYFMNLGFKSAQGKYVCMLSDDCLVVPDAIKNGYKLFEEKLSAGEKIGAMAFYFRDWPYTSGDYRVFTTLYDTLYVNHGLYLKKALEEINYIDEETVQFYYGDCDLCLRMSQKGYKIIDSPDSYIEHFGYAGIFVRQGNASKDLNDMQNFLKKWQAESPDTKVRSKKYDDLNKTYLKFGRFNILRISLLLKLNDLINKSALLKKIKRIFIS